MALSRFLKAAKEIQEQAPPPRSDDHDAPEGNHDESNWLISYADMMTLLCGFFIMLFSMSKLDEHKYDEARESIAKAFNTQVTAGNGAGKLEKPSKELAEFMGRVLVDAGISNEAIVHEESNGVSVVFQSSLFFDTLSSEVKPEGRVVMAKLIENLHSRQVGEKKNYRIVVEGHTDSRPVLGGTFPSNWELSSARAARVLRMFLDRGFAPDRLVAIGYADTHPAADVPSRTPSGEWNEAALVKNRRVVVRVLQSDTDSIPIPSDTPARLPASARNLTAPGAAAPAPVVNVPAAAPAAPAAAPAIPAHASGPVVAAPPARVPAAASAPLPAGAPVPAAAPAISTIATPPAPTTAASAQASVTAVPAPVAGAPVTPEAAHVAPSSH